MSTNNPIEGLLTTAEVAEYVGVGPRTIRVNGKRRGLGRRVGASLHWLWTEEERDLLGEVHLATLEREDRR